MKVYFRNYVMAGSVSLIISKLLTPYEINYSKNYPSVFTSAIWMWIFALIEDFWFYWTHRILHLPYFYKKIHKVHHENYNTISIHCIYTHWIEFLLGNVMGIWLGFFILWKYLHIISFGVWANFRIFESHEVHSGF